MDLEGLKEAMNREPKFHFGDKVSDKDTGETFTVAIVHFDPCDGWEYGPAQDGKFYRLYFEDDLYGA